MLNGLLLTGRWWLIEHGALCIFNRKEAGVRMHQVRDHTRQGKKALPLRGNDCPAIMELDIACLELLIETAADLIHAIHIIADE